MNKSTTLQEVIIKFAGDSGDGMQLTGSQFTHSTALAGNDLATFPDFPAEIRAPAGTLAGVSGFLLHFGSVEINAPGDKYDVLVAMNAAAFKVNIKNLKKAGILILNTAGFESKDLRLAGYTEDANPLSDKNLAENYTIYSIDITRLTRESLDAFDLDGKEKDRSKNMFILGFLFWMYNRTTDSAIASVRQKFKKSPILEAANIKLLQDGYNYGETTEVFTSRYSVEPAKLKPGIYRNIIGNQAIAMGLMAFAVKSNIDVFYGSYPITPASDILHELSKYPDLGVRTFQAEDEIAAVTAAIGASFGGHLGVCGTSGPGMALKAEGIGLAVSTELPLLIVNVQRAGPSTGMPTKTEQADLLQAMYGRNGECPVVVMAAKAPSDCFDAILEAANIAVEHMTPVIILSDGFIANGAEPWIIPDADLINTAKYKAPEMSTAFQPYLRDSSLVRPWALPGQAGFEHRIGGLEKQDGSGNISYDPENHEKMILIRQQKIEKIADLLPEANIEIGKENGDLLILGWGSTYGAIRSAVLRLLEDGHSIAQIHLRHLNPLPNGLQKLFLSYQTVLVPEINNGQLIKILQANFTGNFVALNKIQGLPFSSVEIIEKAQSLLSE